MAGGLEKIRGRARRRRPWDPRHRNRSPQPGETRGHGAHRAGLQGHVEIAADQPRRAQAGRRRLDHQHLGMGGGVAPLLDPVAIPGQHRPVRGHQDGTDRHLAGDRRRLQLPTGPTPWAPRPVNSAHLAERHAEVARVRRRRPHLDLEAAGPHPAPEPAREDRTARNRARADPRPKRATRIGGTSRRCPEILLISPLTTSTRRPWLTFSDERTSRSSIRSGSSSEAQPLVDGCRRRQQPRNHIAGGQGRRHQQHHHAAPARRPSGRAAAPGLRPLDGLAAASTTSGPAASAVPAR